VTNPRQCFKRCKILRHFAAMFFDKDL
jgi:hypothetical protein